MVIDLSALDQAATGNPDAKVIVRKRWLREVHRQLVAAERTRIELGTMKRTGDLLEAVFGPKWPG